MWISCLPRCVGAIDWRKLIDKQAFDNPMDKFVVNVTKIYEMVGYLPRKFSQIVEFFSLVVEVSALL